MSREDAASTPNAAKETDSAVKSRQLNERAPNAPASEKRSRAIRNAAALAAALRANLSRRKARERALRNASPTTDSEE
ncbi:MAG: hypothetical protein N2444_05110 [Methylocystis sp.]|nr:hypothetical protein [Methylocystis sp.]